jgi:hypothetical protein
VKGKGERKEGRARKTQVPSGGRKHIQHKVMGICYEFIKNDYRRSYVEGVKAWRAQSTYYMLEKQ